MAYVDSHARLNPTGLAAAVAINGAVLAALLTAAPAIEKYVPTAIEMFTPRPDPPPPEPMTEPRPMPRSEASIARPEPIIEIATPDPGPVLELSDDPIVTLDPNPGTGTSVTDEPVTPPAPPVLTGAEIDPRYARDFQPPYPASKIRMEEEGRVTVHILVGTNGRVLRIAPVGDADADFFAATRRQALGKWRFRPATRDGVPIEAWRQISVRFELNS